MFWKTRKEKAAEDARVVFIDIDLLEEHLDSIKVALLEIRGFRKKKIIKTPTFHYMQSIDIEEAWPSCRGSLHQAYEQLSHVAEKLDVEHEALPPSASFGRAIDQFVNLIDRKSLILEENRSLSFSPNELQIIDNNILQVQQAVNLLQKRVMVDFTFTRNLKG
jgi:hypothetical protein